MFIYRNRQDVYSGVAVGKISGYLAGNVNRGVAIPLIVATVASGWKLFWTLAIAIFELLGSCTGELRY